MFAAPRDHRFRGTLLARGDTLDIVSGAIEEAKRQGSPVCPEHVLVAAIVSGTLGWYGVSPARARASAALPARRRQARAWEQLRAPQRNGPIVLVGAASNRPVVCRPTVVCVFAASVGAHRWTIPPQLRRYWIDGFRHAGAEVVSDAGLDMRADAFKPEVCRSLREAELVFFCGGRPERIIDALVDTPAYEALVDASDAGATMLGRSAGAMAFGGGTVTNFYSDDEPEPVSFLNWIPDKLEFLHFTPDRDDALRSQLERFASFTALGIGHGDAVLIEPGWERCVSLVTGDEGGSSFLLSDPTAELTPITSVPMPLGAAR
jgi:hypothetical protein